ncbi:MAG: class I SAM-dependent methyltransferase [Clostridia bacterium]|nr:class I SAM-dependent methyltransferase [Clostridia bacterium]
MAEFMSDAYEYNKTHLALMSYIKKEIKSTDYVCDAGCGLGYMSLALAKHCTKVDSVDLAQPPLEILRANITKENITNINVIEKNINNHMPEQMYDKMVFSFFGSTEEALRIGKKMCKDQLILFKNDSSFHRFTMKQKPNKGHTFETSKRTLEKLNIPYRVDKILLEMGQPFRTLEDAQVFFNLYNREPNEPVNLEVIKSSLKQIKGTEFQYFYSVLKPIAIIKVKTKDIPELN